MGSQTETSHEQQSEIQGLDALIGQLTAEQMTEHTEPEQEEEERSSEPILQAEEELITREEREQNEEEEEEQKKKTTEEPVKTTDSLSPLLLSEEMETEEYYKTRKDKEVAAEKEENEVIEKPSQLDSLLEEFKHASQQWNEPSSAFYNLTNRSTPALSSSKTGIQLPPPPLPTLDDLGLEKLRLVDQAFTPPTANSPTVTTTTAAPTVAAAAAAATVIATSGSATKPLIFAHHDQPRVEVTRKSSLRQPAHPIAGDQQAPTQRNSVESKAESDGIGQAYQPPYQHHPSQPNEQYHHPTYHHPHHPQQQQQQQQPYSHHHPHHPQSSYLLQRQTHASVSSLNSAYNSSSNTTYPPAGLSPSPAPNSQSHHPTRPYYPDPHPGLATTTQSCAYPPPGYRDHPHNPYHPTTTQLQSHAPRPTSNHPAAAQAAFGPPLQLASSPAPSLHHVALTRSGTSLSGSSTHSNMLIAPATHQHPHSRPPALMPPKTGPTISKASIDEYRNRIKSDPDPEAHFNYAKFLIEAARKLASGGAAGDDKAIKKYRDALLQESLKLIKKLATQGVGLGKPPYSDAQFFLANCLGNGSLGLAVDHEKAYNLYVQASKQNHPAATYRTAVCNELGAGTRKDPQRAVLFYRKASALGDTAGMYKLGMILLGGLLGQPKNPQEALLWLKRAAQQADEDNPHALHELAQIYEKPPLVTLGPAGGGGGTSSSSGGKHSSSGSGGAGIPQISYLVQRDEAYARELYTQAAQLGYPSSQNRLGACYEYGALSCPVDPRRSIGWYTKAAERGDAESELALSGWYLTGSEGVLKQSDSEAYLWARRAASKGLPKAEYAVGYYAEVGIGVKQDIEEAKRWYMRAATNKNKRAMQRLTELKKMGSQKPAKRQARPTRDQAASECLIV
ncbi:hypothetical protein PCANC_16367 [Puccinia coronata f. sp. avenae]|uniref:Uncharacterized protein n=1 Tax=Puccinia coronata f. sp. avenae TaxID=200324 RepID=A0A2N5S1I8_9BASI|nr:hypothetical protein PCASD_25173 [Puccinia coronata f. sp. avenae]PLW33998.1 hypothetical protein PCANC_16367 [Puccinia coronata f. sp. avenae]